MIQENIKIEKREAGDYSPIPEDVYQVEILDVTSEMKPSYNKPEVMERVLKFQLGLLEGTDKDGSSLKGRSLWRTFVPTYLYVGKNGKNVLYQILEAVKGSGLTPEEEMVIGTPYLNALIGKQLRVTTQNKTKDEKTYSNIATYLPVKAQMTPLTVEEKEAAKPKEKTEEPVTATTNEPPMPNDAPEEEINVEKIPF